MACARLMMFAVCLLTSASARPQFSFFNPQQTGIGVQTPIAGVHLGTAVGLTINVGRQPAQPVAPVNADPVPASQPVPEQPIEDNKAPASEDLGTRIDEPAEGAPVEDNTRTDQPTPDDNPCQTLDASTAEPTETGGDDANGAMTELPCLGIGAGNRINPKHAALLSLVG
uniref:Uncharacterized protein n=1 Tax=Anopheles dirus TaxID=7168 RepID=A0A182NRG1_9DIPT